MIQIFLNVSHMGNLDIHYIILNIKIFGIERVKRMSYCSAHPGFTVLSRSENQRDTLKSSTVNLICQLFHRWIVKKDLVNVFLLFNDFTKVFYISLQFITASTLSHKNLPYTFWFILIILFQLCNNFFNEINEKVLVQIYF